jgi:hypothetical protein
LALGRGSRSVYPSRLRRHLALFLALALPLSAQVVPDEFPDPTGPFRERASRELAERHRPFLSSLYAQSAFAVGRRSAGRT